MVGFGCLESLVFVVYVGFWWSVGLEAFSLAGSGAGGLVGVVLKTHTAIRNLCLTLRKGYTGVLGEQEDSGCSHVALVPFEEHLSLLRHQRANPCTL